jgi:hypothetical protein
MKRFQHLASKAEGLVLVPIETNLVDQVSRDIRGNSTVEISKQESSPSSIFVHPVRYAGKDSSIKVAEIRAKMAAKGADVLVLSALDEIACK